MIDEIKSRCPREIGKETFYSGYEEVGISYGSYFQGVKQIWSNHEEALGFLSIPAGYESELKQYTLHPTLMDGALQTMGAIIASIGIGGGRQPFMPFAVEEVEILQPLKVVLTILNTIHH